jgi:carbonic anhydrase
MNDTVLERLKTGIRRFQTEVYPAQAEHYKRVMSEPQRPHALIITCADSRIHPEVLTQAAPGEVFVTRNIGNMVPAYGEMLGGVSAVLEFAVCAMQVRHIAVCGHSECGAMKALLEPETVKPMPTVRNWLSNASAALVDAEAIQRKRREQGDLRGDDPGELLRVVTERNVLLQMHHVRTHPSVADAIRLGNLAISGWVYEIAAGEVRVCLDGEETFEAMVPREAAQE